ncbi:MAG: VPLPA-CTERM sorting domain-containing protein [Telmatospirillum sp.]|nr:VPLPA-CTERM sorting domain-containing protein [Telmatospirillum sp.]
MRKILALLSGVLFAVSASGARAASLDAATILKDFNAVVFTSGSTGSDIEGAAVFGGNFSGATVYNNPRTTALPSGFSALTVYGNLTGNTLNMNNGASLYVGGKVQTGVNFNSGAGGKKGGFSGPPGVSISSFEKPLIALSNQLSTLAANSWLPPAGNNEVINPSDVKGGVAVFDISAQDLKNIGHYGITINTNGASSVIFNVSGDTITYAANDNQAFGANKILWNFYEAKTVTLDSGIVGTVLAPNATVTSQNWINGSLIANAWKGIGELHSYGFDGGLPSPVPEPASTGLLLAGLAGLGLLRHRRRP